MQNATQQTDIPMILKILIMAGMALFLLIPLALIQVLISERQVTRVKAEREIVNSQGGEQTITGLMISVPYIDRNGTQYMLFMPDTLSVSGTLDPSILHRSIYDVVVYNTDVSLSGTTAIPSFNGLPVAPNIIRWDLARAILSFKSPLGLREQVSAVIDGKKVSFVSENDHKGVFSFTLSAPLDLSKRRFTGKPIDFSFALKLKGGQSLTFVPTAADTSVKLSSSWQDPGFFGSPLPIERRIDEKGFSAKWKLVGFRFIPERVNAGEISNLIPRTVRYVNDEWDEGRSMNPADGKLFGVRLMIPVDTYVKSDRSAKYGILFLLVPFVSLLLFELFAKVRIHLVQYFLVAVANIVFYLLLISLSEHTGFDVAYFAAAGVTTLLTAFYAAAFLKSMVRSLFFGGILALFYFFLYVLLLSQEYALLVGALGVFAVLTLLMLLTRKVDWYALKNTRVENRVQIQKEDL
ncbi:MAG: cell envelope integrity protein CreD [Spirochaetales bacterium]|nr:cell envelope integrity protein CreD [Spirochaetales bacterium]